MLFTIKDSGVINQINYIPYEAKYNLWRSRLTDNEYNAIIDTLNNRIDGKQIETAGWIPGNNWAGTVYEPIYTKACNYNEEQSGLCFGLFVWVVFLQRDDSWSFGKYEVNNIPIRSMTYFRIQI
jgi:hypothetical protein